MLPEFKYFLFAFFIVIFGTKNGRAIRNLHLLCLLLLLLLLHIIILTLQD